MVLFLNYLSVDSSFCHGIQQLSVDRGSAANSVTCSAPMPSDQDTNMLDLRPNCECCDKDLPPDSTDAMICSFECTFCRNCAQGTLGGRCPNCGGDLSTRPTRSAEKLARFPVSTKRVLKPDGCAARAA
jgi:uncharacterized protein